MLKIIIPDTEMYDEAKKEFVKVNKVELTLIHSLVSISKWESKFKKPFLTKTDKSTYETIYYIKCMCLNTNVDPLIFEALSQDNLDIISNYVASPATATTFPSNQDTIVSKQQTITSEIIYYWMIMFNIPVEFEKWHFDRLLTLIKICDIYNNPKKNKKMSLEERRALNNARRSKLNTKG